MTNTPAVEVRETEGGQIQVVVTGRLPQATVAENAKWPWGPWQVGYQKQQTEKSALRLLESVANERAVGSAVEQRQSRREAERAEKLAAKSAVVAASSSAQPAAAVPAAVEVTAPASPRKQKSVRSGRVSRRS